MKKLMAMFAVVMAVVLGAVAAEHIKVDEVVNHFPGDGKLDCVVTISGLESNFLYKIATTLTTRRDGEVVRCAFTNAFVLTDGTYTNEFDLAALLGPGDYPNGGIFVDLIKEPIDTGSAYANIVSSASGAWFAVDTREVKDTTWGGGLIVGGATNIILQSSPNAWSEEGGGTSATITWVSTNKCISTRVNSGTLAINFKSDTLWWTPYADYCDITLTYTCGSVVKTAKFSVVCVQPDGGPYFEIVDGVVWQFNVLKGEAVVTGVSGPDIGELTVPSVLGFKSVTQIGDNSISSFPYLTSVTIPSSVIQIGKKAFSGCEKLADVTFEGNAISLIAEDAFSYCNWDLLVHVPDGWTGRSSTLLGHAVVREGDEKPLELLVTNVVVHYVLNSIQPEIAVPLSFDTGFVAVIAEVIGNGVVSIPVEWKDNYPQFEAMYGHDFGTALMRKSGKKDGTGNEMFVWQDYVAGTDPTDVTDVFTASITFVDDLPVISYSPELTAEQKVLRTYKIYAKRQLHGDDWTDVTNVDGVTKKQYNFFKVTVEMKYE